MAMKHRKKKKIFRYTIMVVFFIGLFTGILGYYCFHLKARNFSRDIVFSDSFGQTHSDDVRLSDIYADACGDITSERVSNTLEQCAKVYMEFWLYLDEKYYVDLTPIVDNLYEESPEESSVYSIEETNEHVGESSPSDMAEISGNEESVYIGEMGTEEVLP